MISREDAEKTRKNLKANETVVLMISKTQFVTMSVKNVKPFVIEDLIKEKLGNKKVGSCIGFRGKI
jgi:cytoplasmic iron level regulating protein YaaA (DUF328/UPF0246 family)